MKSKFISLFLMVFSLGIWAQSDDQNYTKTITYKVETLTPISEPALNQAVVQIEYFDGLGRPIQTIAKGQSADDKNIVTHIEYDGYGRQSQEFLPYESEDPSLNYILGAEDQTLDFYNNENYQNTTNPYSKTLYENSPLNRVLKQAAPGNAWAMESGHEIKFAYETNIANEVIAFKAIAIWNDETKLYDITLHNSDVYYSPNQLYKNVIWDENNAYASHERTEEFKDKEGKVVLKRAWAKVNGISVEKHDTYYVYDQFGNLTFVIPPAVSTGSTIDTNTLNGLCYQYKYDGKNRLVAKKLPGIQWEYTIYDNLDRIRATGPSLSPFSNIAGNGWLITKYDEFNRPILSAWKQVFEEFNELLRKTTQNELIAVNYLSENASNSSLTVNGVTFFYTNQSYPNSANSYHILTVNYYDNYRFINSAEIPTQVLGQSIRTVNKIKGLSTGSLARVLEASNNYNVHTSFAFYKTDRMSNPIKIKTIFKGFGYTQKESFINFIGIEEQSITKHKKSYGDLEMVITENFTYSNQGRLLIHTHKINNEPLEFLSINSYDKLGKLSIKQVGGNGLNRLQNVNYKYNIRGWLTDINNIDEEMSVINDDLFSYRMNYQNPENNGEFIYNGNISETYWKSRSDNQIRMYDYDYDGLNRLQSAKFMNINQGIIKTYNESLTYDKNGNIMSLIRRGGYENPLEALIIDNLTYQYDPNSNNQLKKIVDLSNSQQGFKDDSNGTLVGDLSDDYLYDSYGNMTKDENKNITSIVYNYLNLPTKIIFGTGSTISYTYDSTGVKLKKIVTSNNTISTTEYLSGFQYNNNVLQFIPHAEGYVKHTLWINGPLQVHFYNYIYQYKDHLGNIRINYTWNDDLNELSIVEENHYYPFGLKHGNYNLTKQEFEPEVTTSSSSIRLVQVPNSGYQYQYNGQEWQDELGLNMTTMDFRQYDNTIGRFVGMDKLTELTYEITPYRFAMNNPIYFDDPTGLCEECNQNVNNPLEGDVYNSSGGGEYHYSNGEWVRNDGQLAEVFLGMILPYGDWNYGIIDNNNNNNNNNNNSENTIDILHYGTEATFVGDVVSIAGYYQYNKQFWLDKNFKFRSSSFNGNKFTGGKIKFAKTLSKDLSRASVVLNIYSIAATYEDYKNGDISKNRMVQDQIVNGIGFLGPYGASFNLGWNLGYLTEHITGKNIQFNWQHFQEGRSMDRWFDDPEKQHSIFSDEFLKPKR